MHLPHPDELTMTTEILAHYQAALSQACAQLQTGQPDAEANALELLKNYRRWLRTQVEAETVAAILDPEVEALKDALTRQCRR